MALITSGCDAMCSPEHQMDLITSDCAPSSDEAFIKQFEPPPRLRQSQSVRHCLCLVFPLRARRRPRRSAPRPSPLKCDTNRFEIIPTHDHSRTAFSTAFQTKTAPFPADLQEKRQQLKPWERNGLPEPEIVDDEVAAEAGSSSEEEDDAAKGKPLTRVRPRPSLIRSTTRAGWI